MTTSVRLIRAWLVEKLVLSFRHLVILLYTNFFFSYLAKAILTLVIAVLFSTRVTLAVLRTDENSPEDKEML